MHQVVPHLPLVPFAVKAPQLLPDVLFVPLVRELEQPALFLALDNISGQLDRHLLGSDDKSPAYDAFLDVVLKIVLQF